MELVSSEAYVQFRSGDNMVFAKVLASLNRDRLFIFLILILFLLIYVYQKVFIYNLAYP